LIPNPIRKVLSSMQKHQVRYLLMGGQACVFYGAAEFSRDTDLAVLPATDNLEVLRLALEDLQAELIAVPGFDLSYLHRGQAIHFRSRHPDCAGLRVDVMSVMRGVDAFPLLWERRTTADLGDGMHINLMSLPDLVRAKKTQRDKDWPMLRRLVEAHFFRHRHESTSSRLDFWLAELRTPELLMALAQDFPAKARALQEKRPLLIHAIAQEEEALIHALAEEEAAERAADRAYWLPLKRELEALRRGGRT
jgi:hypothetical protein